MTRNVGNLDIERQGDVVSVRVRHVVLHAGGQPGRYGEALLAYTEVRKLITILEDCLSPIHGYIEAQLEDNSDLA